MRKSQIALGERISKPLDFKIFWGGMPPDPPSGLRLRRSRAPPLILPLLWHCIKGHQTAASVISGFYSCLKVIQPPISGQLTCLHDP